MTGIGGNKDITAIEPGQVLISMESLTLDVSGNPLFADTNWQMHHNEQWALVGPNGSGKSVLARAIMGAVRLRAGRIRYHFPGAQDGAPSPRSWFNRGEIVIVSPESHRQLLPARGWHQARWNSIGQLDSPRVQQLLTGRSIEGFTPFQVGRTQLSEDTYAHRRERALGLLGIEHLPGRKVIQLSDGETRKVLIARAMMQTPELLILDDPFCGLDVASRETLASAIDNLLGEEITRVLLITSRDNEVPSAITHVARVAQCQVVEKGPRESVLKARPSATGKLESNSSKTPAAPPLPQPAIPGAPPPPLLVDMKNVDVTYGKSTILKDITWQVRPGENWAILGHNGAGKTTLLSLILGDNPQSYGNQISLFGIRRGSGESIWDIKGKIGWVSPELRVHYRRDTSCIDVVCSGLFDSVGLYKSCTQDQRDLAAEWLRALDIQVLADCKFGSVSVGQQRLVLIARALVKHPVLLILDEPCQGLDATNRQTINNLLDRICDELPINLICITHHADELPRSITHRMTLANGSIVKMESIR